MRIDLGSHSSAQLNSIDQLTANRIMAQGFRSTKVQDLTHQSHYWPAHNRTSFVAHAKSASKCTSQYKRDRPSPSQTASTLGLPDFSYRRFITSKITPHKSEPVGTPHRKPRHPAAEAKPETAPEKHDTAPVDPRAPNEPFTKLALFPQRPLPHRKWTGLEPRAEAKQPERGNFASRQSPLLIHRNLEAKPGSSHSDTLPRCISSPGP